MTDLELRILRLIPVGADTPRQSRYIADLVGVDIRTLREKVQHLIIRYGIPIVAKRGANNGYYIPANDSERLEGIRELKAQHDAEGKRLDVLIGADLQAYKEYLQDENRTNPTE